MSVMKKLSALAAAAGIALSLVATASASVLYDNGPVNGNNDAWTINSGYAVANSFTLANASILTGANFSVWNLPGDLTTAVDWSIVTAPTLGSILASGTAAVSSSFEFVNSFGYDINLNSISLPNIALAAGTYWFELQNAVSNSAYAIYWDINGGPSSIWESAYGYNPQGFSNGLNNASNSFQITSSGPNPNEVPEPAALGLLGLGLLGLGLMRRRNRA